MFFNTRSCGTLLHLTSLWGRYGIGDIGPEAEAFVGWLADNGQRWWQILPLPPTRQEGQEENSPYCSSLDRDRNPWADQPR
jgi:4-alpha-glucanotransferase